MSLWGPQPAASMRLSGCLLNCDTVSFTSSCDTSYFKPRAMAATCLTFTQETSGFVWTWVFGERWAGQLFASITVLKSGEDLK